MMIMITKDMNPPRIHNNSFLTLFKVNMFSVVLTKSGQSRSAKNKKYTIKYLDSHMSDKLIFCIIGLIQFYILIYWNYA